MLTMQKARAPVEDCCEVEIPPPYRSQRKKNILAVTSAPFIGSIQSPNLPVRDQKYIIHVRRPTMLPASTTAEIAERNPVAKRPITIVAINPKPMRIQKREKPKL